MTGEKIPGDLKAWNYFGTDPNVLLTYTYDILQQRSTTLYHTHPPVSAAINKITTYAIGSGTVFRSQPDWQTLEITREYAKEWGQRFQKLVHYVFLLTNFYEKQSILFRTAKIQGDSLLFFDRTVSDMPFDLIEVGGDHIDFDYGQLYNDDKVTLGIIHDALMRKKGFVGVDEKPVLFKDVNGDQNAIQFYNKQIARQLRGYPAAYRIISAAKNNDRWWDATLARLVLEATILAKTNNINPEDTKNQTEAYKALTTGETRTPTETGLSTVGNIAGHLPGSMFNFGAKGDIEFMDMKAPANNFDKMQTAYLDMVAMSFNIGRGVLMSNYPTSYTSHKGEFNDFIQVFMSERKLFCKSVSKPVIIEIAKWLFLNNYIEMPNAAFFDNRIIQEATVAGLFLGPVPGHINPKQEVDAKIAEVGAGFDLRSNKALENGHEWDNFLLEWQQEEEAYNAQSVENQVNALVEQMQTDEEQTNEDENNVNNDQQNEDENVQEDNE